MYSKCLLFWIELDLIFQSLLYPLLAGLIQKPSRKFLLFIPSWSISFLSLLLWLSVVLLIWNVQVVENIWYATTKGKEKLYTELEIIGIIGLFKILFIFSWRITALQYCISFCHTSTYVPSLLKLPPTSHPSRLLQSPVLNSLSHTANSHCLSILHIVV